MPRALRLTVLTALLLVAPGLARAAAPYDQYLLAPATVTDRQTGLVWQRNFSSQQSQTRDAAQLTCQGLTLGGVGGFRLPSVLELLSILDPRATTLSSAQFTGPASYAALWTANDQAVSAGTGLWQMQLTAERLVTVTASATGAFICVR